MKKKNKMKILEGIDEGKKRKILMKMKIILRISEEENEKKMKMKIKLIINQHKVK